MDPWGKHNKGDKKDLAKTNKTAKTVFMLMYGKFRFSFPDLQKNVLLQNEADYLFFENGIAHSWEALEDSLAITIRWPSLIGDQS